MGLFGNREMAAKTSELRALYRQAYLYEYEHKNGVTAEEAVAAYQEHSREAKIPSMRYAQMQRLTVDKVLDSQAPWETLRDGYYNASKASNEMQSDVLCSVYKEVSKEAMERACLGEFSKANVQYLTDSEQERARDLFMYRESLCF